MTQTGRAFLVVHPDDNVATLIDDHEALGTLSDGMPISKGIAFGHKCAIRPIAAGTAIVKYGVTIGHSLFDIDCGQHVHVHNCR